MIAQIKNFSSMIMKHISRSIDSLSSRKTNHQWPMRYSLELFGKWTIYLKRILELQRSIWDVWLLSEFNKSAPSTTDSSKTEQLITSARLLAKNWLNNLFIRIINLNKTIAIWKLLRRLDFIWKEGAKTIKFLFTLCI